MLIQALVIRCTAFALALGLLPWSVLPLTGRIALALTGLLLFMPALPSIGGEDAVYGQFIATLISRADGRSFLGPSLLPPPSVLLGEAGIGILLAAALSIPIYIAQLSGRWIQRTVTQDGERVTSLQYTDTASSALALGFVLFSAYVLIHTPWFPAIWEEFARSLSLMPLGQNTGVAGAAGTVISFGSRAFLGAVVLTAPLLAVTVAFHLLLIFTKRYFPQFVSDTLARGALQPLLLLGLSLLLFSMAGELTSLLRESVGFSREIFQ